MSLLEQNRVRHQILGEALTEINQFTEALKKRRGLTESETQWCLAQLLTSRIVADGTKRGTMP